MSGSVADAVDAAAVFAADDADRDRGAAVERIGGHRFKRDTATSDHPQPGRHRHTFLAPDPSRRHPEIPSTSAKTNEDGGRGMRAGCGGNP